MFFFEVFRSSGCPAKEREASGARWGEFWWLQSSALLCFRNDGCGDQSIALSWMTGISTAPLVSFCHVYWVGINTFHGICLWLSLRTQWAPNQRDCPIPVSIFCWCPPQILPCRVGVNGVSTLTERAGKPGGAEDGERADRHSTVLAGRSLPCLGSCSFDELISLFF